MKKTRLGFAILALVAATGCSTFSTAAGQARSPGIDVVVATDAEGHRMMVIPSAGLMLRDGSRETVDVDVRWQVASDVSKGRMQVFTADGARLLADVSVADLVVQHRTRGGAGAGAGFASLEAGHADPLAALAPPISE
jgi:hypothetical protein